MKELLLKALQRAMNCFSVYELAIGGTYITLSNNLLGLILLRPRSSIEPSNTRHQPPCVILWFGIMSI